MVSATSSDDFLEFFTSLLHEVTQVGSSPQKRTYATCQSH